MPPFQPHSCLGLAILSSLSFCFHSAVLSCLLALEAPPLPLSTAMACWSLSGFYKHFKLNESENLRVREYHGIRGETM